jgi:hypothetical protein
MPIGRTELNALRNLISEADLILETTPPLPQNRTGAARENLKAALALVEDLIGQTWLSAGAIMGRKGGASIATRGPGYFRQLAAKRKPRGGRKTAQATTIPWTAPWIVPMKRRFAYF